ncbi:hypothetical protein Tco_0804776 [Tanacetum coccineum]|uniref:Xylulose kinase-1 n=1 Tax=Tanacetum coccineum TaxID=301880 RepID=A0ABQ5A9K8_9ASTR
MTTLKFADTHNMVAFLSKPAESDGFEQIVDFLNAQPIRYALTVNPTIYISCIEQFWSTGVVKTINGEVQLHALVDGKKIIISEASVRRDLKLEDEEGIDCLPNSTIFEQLALMGYEKISQKLTFYKPFFSPQWKFLIHTILQCLSSKTTAWNEFSSTMASAIICLATNQKFNFSKFIFEGMIRNLDNVSGKFLMYPSENVADEVVHKELGDSLVRVATTASSLEVEQDSGNITKTRSKATPNESSSLGTTSGGDPKCQEIIGDTIAQTSLKLNELMELCTTLQKKVLDLEKTKTTQANEITSLKRRVKKLEKKDRSRTYKLKRLYKVGLTARVESSGDEEDLGEDASKQGRRINVIDADEDITLVNVQDDANNEMFDVNALNVSTAATTVTITTKEITLAQALEALKTSKPKDKGKGIMIEEHVKPMKKKVQIMLDEEAALKLQAEFHEEERLAREKIDADHQLAERLQAQEQEELSDAEKATVNTFEDFRTELVEGKEKRAGEELIQESSKKQKVDDDKEIAELKQCMEIIPDEEEVTIDDIPLVVKPLRIVDWKIHKKGKKSYYQIIRADGKYGSTRLVESMDYLLLNDMKIMFEPHVEDEVWKLQNGYKVLEWKLYDSCGGRIVRIKSLLDAVWITAARVFVNVAQMKLVLLMNFKENILSS